ncbi:MAG: stalk domain-containing protein [Desulfitobacteriaceae bacterium]|nr:stalk domain-containing protein [Desulfitobacteriaceae bacterium]
MKTEKRIRVRFILFRVMLIWAIFSIISVVPLQATSTTEICQLSESQNYRVENIYYVENVGTKKATDVTIKIQYINPYLTKIMPYSTLINSGYEPQPAEITTDAKGNQKGTYNIPLLKPGEERIIRVIQDYRVSLADYNIQPEQVEPYQFQSETLLPYLSPSPGIESTHPLIQAKAGELVGNETNPFEKAKKIFTFVNEYMTYTTPDRENPETDKGALWALQAGEGVCEDYADLMVALLRAVGVPSRTVAGWAGEVKDGGTKIADRTGALLPGHMWLEYYLPGYGWIPADPTFTYLVNNERQVDYNRLMGIKQPCFAETSEVEGHSVSYSFRGDVKVSCEVTVNKLDTAITGSFPVEGIKPLLLYLEDIPLIFDVNPVIENGRTLVPMRGIFQALGATVDWDGSLQKVTAGSGGRKVELQIGSNLACVNGGEVVLDVPAAIRVDRTMIPLRFVGEALGCRVDWDGGKRTINLHFN